MENLRGEAQRTKMFDRFLSAKVLSGDVGSFVTIRQTSRKASSTIHTIGWVAVSSTLS
jgi:hypothetical protein